MQRPYFQPAARHIYCGGNRFTTRFDKDHFEAVIKARRDLSFGEDYRVTSEIPSSTTPNKGA